jgi:hypothetical protein
MMPMETNVVMLKITLNFRKSHGGSGDNEVMAHNLSENIPMMMIMDTLWN